MVLATRNGVRSEPRLANFSGLRALSASAIVVYHAAAISGYRTSGTLSRLPYHLLIGVWVFFVISGFLLYRPWALAHRRQEKGPRLADYFRNRVLRIFPGYWAALLILTLGFHATGVETVREGLIHFGLLQIYVGQGQLEGIPPAWSLATEISFYAFLPLYAATVRRLARVTGSLPAELIALVVMFVGGTAFRQWSIRTGVPRAGLWLPASAGVFALGMALAVVEAWGDRAEFAGFKKFAGGYPGVWWCVAAGLLLTLVAGRNGPTTLAGELGGRPELELIYPLLAFCLVAPVSLSAKRESWVEIVLESRVVASLGTVSYGIFLWHYHVLTGLRSLLSNAGTVATPGFGALLMLGYPASVAVACGSWFLIERPALSRKARPAPS